MKDTMPAIETSTAAGGALIKIFGVPVLAGAAATALAFMFMWPKTLKEAFFRLTCAIASSVFFGPVLVLAAWATWPKLFDGAIAAARAAHMDPLAGVFVVAAPFLLVAALPAWWVIGGVLLWFDRRKGKDIGEMAHDAAAAVKDVRGAL